MNPVEQVFPPPEELSGHADSPPPQREQTLELVRENQRLVRENQRLRAELILANQRIVALEARINRGDWP